MYAAYMDDEPVGLVTEQDAVSLIREVGVINVSQGITVGGAISCTIWYCEPGAVYVPAEQLYIKDGLYAEHSFRFLKEN